MSPLNPSLAANVDKGLEARLLLVSRFYSDKGEEVFGQLLQTRLCQLPEAESFMLYTFSELYELLRETGVVTHDGLLGNAEARWLIRWSGNMKMGIRLHDWREIGTMWEERYLGFSRVKTPEGHHYQPFIYNPSGD